MVCKDSYRNKIITYEYSYRDKIDIQMGWLQEKADGGDLIQGVEKECIGVDVMQDRGNTSLGCKRLFGGGSGQGRKV